MSYWTRSTSDGPAAALCSARSAPATPSSAAATPLRADRTASAVPSGDSGTRVSDRVVERDDRIGRGRIEHVGRLVAGVDADRRERLLELQHVGSGEPGAERAVGGEFAGQNDDRPPGHLQGDGGRTECRPHLWNSAGDDGGSAEVTRLELDLDGIREGGVAADGHIVRKGAVFHRNGDGSGLGRGCVGGRLAGRHDEEAQPDTGEKRDDGDGREDPEHAIALPDPAPALHGGVDFNDGVDFSRGTRTRVIRDPRRFCIAGVLTD